MDGWEEGGMHKHTHARTLLQRTPGPYLIQASPVLIFSVLCSICRQGGESTYVINHNQDKAVHLAQVC